MTNKKKKNKDLRNKKIMKVRRLLEHIFSIPFFTIILSPIYIYDFFEYLFKKIIKKSI